MKQAETSVIADAIASWAPEVLVGSTWSGNALRFATQDEAERYASDLLMRWFVPTDSRAVASSDPVTYTYVRGGLEPVSAPTATVAS